MFLNSTTPTQLKNPTSGPPTIAEIYGDVYDRLGTAGTAVLSLAVTRAIQTAADGYLTAEFQAAERGEITLEDLRDAITVYLAAIATQSPPAEPK
jgi:hypothetical protein